MSNQASIAHTPISMLRAKSEHALRKLLAAVTFASPAPQVPRISDRIARDIGLSPAELERLRFELPSQSADRPLI